MAKFTQLKTLRLDVWLLSSEDSDQTEVPVPLVAKAVTVQLSVFPKTIENLVMAKEVLNNGNDAKGGLNGITLPSVKFFYCEFCHMDDELIDNLPKIFPNIQSMVLKTENEKVNVKILVENLKSLQWLFLDVSSSYVNRKPSIYYTEFAEINLLGIQDFPGGAEHVGSTDRFYFRKESDGNWNLTKLYDDVLDEKLEFEGYGLINFFTSEIDYQTKSRVNSVERTAYRSGIYEFDGGIGTGSSFALATNPASQVPLKLFPQISESVQYKLSSIHISNAQISASELYNSIGFALRLNTLISDRVNFQGSFERFLPLHRLKIFKLNRVVSEKEIDSYTKSLPKLRGLIPIESRTGNEFSDGESEKFFKNLRNQSQLTTLELRSNDEIKLSINYESSTLVVNVDFEADGLINQMKEYIQNLALKVDYSYIERPAIPTQIQNVIIHVDRDITPLRYKSTFPYIQSNSSFREVTILKPDDARRLDLSFSQLAGSSHSLTYLSVTRFRLNLDLDVKFTSLSTIFLQDCLLNEKFENEFFQIFPSLRSLAMVISGDEHTLTNERILLSALRNKSTKWLFGFVRENKESQAFLEIIKMLNETNVQPLTFTFGRRGDKENYIAFILERPTNVNWVSALRSNNSAEEQLETVMNYISQFNGSNVFKGTGQFPTIVSPSISLPTMQTPNVSNEIDDPCGSRISNCTIRQNVKNNAQSSCAGIILFNLYLMASPLVVAILSPFFFT